MASSTLIKTTSDVDPWTASGKTRSSGTSGSSPPMARISADRRKQSIVDESELISVLTIKKVLNSSVVLVVDEMGQETILLGKGIGYGQKAGTPVPSRDGDQVFISLPNPEVKNLVDLLTAIPVDYIEVTREIVDHAESLQMNLDAHIYLALTDHL